MTRDEAIGTLQAHVVFACEKAMLSSTAIRMIEDALDMAIEALQTDGDCISRQAALDEAEDWLDCYAGDDYEDIRAGIKQVMRSLKKLPSVQPDNSCDGCRYENADDGVLVPCGFCKRSHSDNYERRTDG